MIRWIDGEESKWASSAIADYLGTSIHPSALDHLQRGDGSDVFPLPRLESHGSYLFGIIFFPSNVENPSADFDSLSFLTTHDSIVARVTRHSTSSKDWDLQKSQLREIDSTDETPDGGQFLLNVLRHAVQDQAEDATSIFNYLTQISDEVGGGVDLTRNLSELTSGKRVSSRERRSTLHSILRVLPTISGITSEMPAIRRVVVETSHILESLVRNDPDRDLQFDQNGSERELFSRSLEIYLIDLLVESRRVISLLDDIEALLTAITARAQQLGEEENVAAGRFTGAIASIMLLPTFIVGLYGQNFVDIPEAQWQYGYLFSWILIIGLTVFQVWFFKRRRWL